MKKFQLDICYFNVAPNKLKIQVFEFEGMKVVMKRLMHYSNLHKQILFICSIDPNNATTEDLIPLKSKLTIRKVIKNLQFFAINGQHNMETSKSMSIDLKYMWKKDLLV